MQQLKQHIVCFEHEYLYAAGTLHTAQPGQRAIPQALFDELFEQPKIWLKRDWLGRQAVLKTCQYIGVVQGKCGHSLEILPKTGKAGQSHEQIRLMLLTMLQALPQTPFKRLDQRALVQKAKLPLLNIFVGQALQDILSVLQQGTKRHYHSRQGNLPVWRGRLLVQQHILHNHSHHERFYTEHDEYSSNCPENRLLKRALQCLTYLACTASNQQLLQVCLQRMRHIPASTHIAQDFKAVCLDRNQHYYWDALQWARLIIDGFAPVTGKGEQPAFSLLFDMNQLFENIVASCLKKQLPSGWQLKVQQQAAALLQVNNQPQQKLQPDLLLLAEQRPVAILDTKWKILSGTTFSQLKPSEPELYQMFAYAAAYLPQGGEVCLVYPKTAQFHQAVEQAVFQHIRDAKVHLKLLPFCLETFCLLNAPFTQLGLEAAQHESC
ncbi:McrC family protein [Alkanindiges sp. WGS2144]|uniref:McrC family protein n=1 Tax=Alkanindiges sp. WGS2144 TaxID=3366808 RepID=UPI0037518D8E